MTVKPYLLGLLFVDELGLHWNPSLMQSFVQSQSTSYPFLLQKFHISNATGTGSGRQGCDLFRISPFSRHKGACRLEGWSVFALMPPQLKGTI